MAGSDEFDPNARCLSAGMPNMMGMTYGMEVQHTKDKITMYGELNDVYRRIFLDGRKPSQRVLDDPTFAGYSTGHWEGDTLVVDTVAIREDTLFDTFSPHSDQFTVRERIRFTSPGILEDRITVMDPKALLEPFTSVRTYRKVSRAERRVARVLVRGGIGVREVGLETCPRVTVERRDVRVDNCEALCQPPLGDRAIFLRYSGYSVSGIPTTASLGTPNFFVISSTNGFFSGR